MFHRGNNKEFGVQPEACVSWLCPYRNVGFVFATCRSPQFGALYCKSETMASTLKHPRIPVFGLRLVGNPNHEVLTSDFLTPELQASDFLTPCVGQVITKCRLRYSVLGKSSRSAGFGTLCWASHHEVQASVLCVGQVITKCRLRYSVLGKSSRSAGACHYEV